MRPALRRFVRLVVLSLAVTVAGALALGACMAWSPREFDSLPAAPRPAVPRAGHVGVVTLNTWRLREPARVPRLVSALARLGGDVQPGAPAAPGDEARALPDVIAFQELEGEQAIRALASRLLPSHAFATCVCARDGAGRNRSVVGLAVRRDGFALARAPQCVALGRLWPDHPRCALLARVAPADAPDAPFTVAVVHLSSRPWNGAQAERLASALRANGAFDTDATLVAGDMNFTPGSRGYRALARPPLRDPFGAARGRTHWFGGRLDHVFTSPGLTLVRPLDRALAYRVIQPGSTLEPPARCAHAPRDDCPVSDHLAEGGVFRYATLPARASSAP